SVGCALRGPVAARLAVPQPAVHAEPATWPALGADSGGRSSAGHRRPDGRRPAEIGPDDRPGTDRRLARLYTAEPERDPSSALLDERADAEARVRPPRRPGPRRVPDVFRPRSDPQVFGRVPGPLAEGEPT